MSKVLVLDLETTYTMVPKYGKAEPETDIGSPFNDTNRVVLAGVKDLETGVYTHRLTCACRAARLPCKPC